MNLPTRKCNCSGTCRTDPQDLTRREFLGLLSAGTAATLLATPAWGAFSLPPDEYERWKRELLGPSKPRAYSSATHTDARMHLGGIGTGNFELGADGQLTTWQLFNTLRDGQVPFYFLARAGDKTKLLQTAAGPDWPRVKQIHMTGEYPIATLRFEDPDLPVQLELRAFTPFAPLDVNLSSLPLAAFIFRIHNPTQQIQTVSLGALMQNPVGYEAASENPGIHNVCFGSSVNEVLREGQATGLLLRAQPGAEPSLNHPVTIFAGANLQGLSSPPPDRPENLKVEVLGVPGLPASIPEPSHSLIWLEDAPTETPDSLLRAAREAVQAGATLVFSGKSLPLLQSYASWTGGQPLAQHSPRADILFEDFEKGYENWRIEGKAFGSGPAHGTLPNQQRVSGFLGQGLVNTYLDGDGTIGRLISKPFKIERRYIRFLVGGGSHAGTQIRLVVNDKIVRATSGKDNERLEPALWPVDEFEGQTARIEIVDENTGGWGHINVDQIEFSDLPGSRAVMELLEELLPARFSQVRPANADSQSGPAVEFQDLKLQPNATQLTVKNGLRLISRPLGKGKVVIAAGPVLDPAQAGISRARQSAYTLLCSLLGARYQPINGANPKAPGFGSLALASLGGKTTVLPAFNEWEEAWKMFSASGAFLTPDQAAPNPPTPAGQTVNGAVASTVEVAPGASAELPFLLAWHYPNQYSQSQTWMGCLYATRWPDARALMRQAAADFPTWRQRTQSFRDTFYDSTLPYWLLDCLTANAAIFRHVGVVFRLANGDVYGWEGSNGCCEPTCTHVWGYEQSFARLFPTLEKDMRRIDFKHQQRDDGGVNNRTDVPSPRHPTGEQPFADGHASCILKAYREALNHPDDSFLKDYWPHIQRAAQYLIDRDAKSSGGTPSGILQDDQWNTYDEALHGVTTFISGYYLAALRAGEEWARRMGETSTADRFHQVFLKGQTKLLELCWNGEYFQQHLSDYAKRPGEVGPGCMSDQLIGQWWAHQLGLGYLLPQEKVLSSLHAIFKYNFMSDLTGWKHAPRAFTGAKDKGLIICTWPKGGRPTSVMLYSDEVWTGIEYQVAAHMIYEGLIEEGLSIVKAARDRYDGLPRRPIARNPWNEIECGGHYARAMSSWSLLLALSGWEYDGPRESLRWTPRMTPANFRSFFSGPEGWGTLRQSRSGTSQQNELELREGRLTLSQLTLAPAAGASKALVEHAGKSLANTRSTSSGLLIISLATPVVLRAGEALKVTLNG
jgi:uncharacterized protein (DUF608 family)